MRYLLFVLLCLFGSNVLAQIDSSAQKVDMRIMFRSKVTQLTSYLDEGNEKAARTLFKDVRQDMEAFIARSQSELDTAQANKQAIKTRRDNQVQLLQQFKSFQGNLLRNRSSIRAWTDRFVQTLYPQH